MKLLLQKLQSSKDFWFVVLLSVLSFLLRIPSFFEPYWYGDEGVYQDIGLAISHGRLLYVDIYDNKPPLLYLLYSLFNSDQFTIRVVSFFFTLIAIICFFLISKKLFEKRLTQYITTLFFTLFLSLPILEGNIANAENFMIAPILVAALIIVLYQIHITSKSHKSFKLPLFIAGFLLSLVTLFKIVGIFDTAAFGIFLFFIHFNTISTQKKSGYTIQKDILNFLRAVKPFLIGFFIPFVFTVLFFLFHGAMGSFLKAAFSQNVGYVGYGNTFLIPQGFLILKVLVLFIFIAIVFSKRKSFSWMEIFIFIWFAFSLFNAFFSGRPYTHYLLVLLPSFSLLLGLVISRNKYQLFSLIVLVVTLVLIYQSFWWYKKNIAYYQNFMVYITGAKTIEQYQKFFDSDTPTNYALADFIKTHTKADENVFIWGNNAQVYKLANKVPPTKYIVAYHTTSTAQTKQETCMQLQKTKIKYIFVMPGVGSLPCHLIGYTFLFTMNGVQFYEHSF